LDEQHQRKILCVGGSLNQTGILHKITRNLPDVDCRFTPFFAQGFYAFLAKTGALNYTIMGGAHRRATLKFIRENNLALDEDARQGPYDLILTCTDLIIPPRLRESPIVLVQEGITENEGLAYWLVKNLRLPRVLANTAATGLSDAYVYFCVASAGYRSLFIHKGVDPRKIIVTGIPNFDHASSYRNNHFPYRGYALVATSSIRETFGFDDRMAFLRKAKSKAGKRRVIIKLHPNEDQKRAEEEIRQVFPDCLIFREGNLHEMIANCDLLIAQNTSAIFTAVALRKRIYTSIPRKTLRQLLPQQNGGVSAERIAEVCRKVLDTPPVLERHPKRIFGGSLFPDLLEGL
jgi:hypothetical protein